MADKVIEELKKLHAPKVSVEVKVTQEEMAILEKKLSSIGAGKIGDILRGYLLNTNAFKVENKTRPKPKQKEGE